MIVYEHAFSFLLLMAAVLIILGAGLYSAWHYLPRNRTMSMLCVLFAVTLAGLVWCLLLPGFREQSTQLIKPRFLVVLDTSKSMDLRPDDEGSTRWTNVQEVLSMPWMNTLSAETDVALHTFASDVHEHSDVSTLRELTPDGSATLLRDAINRLAERYRGLSVAGALVLTDGSDTREAATTWATDPLPFKVFTLQTEEEDVWTKQPEVRIDSVITPRRVNRGWKSELTVALSGQGTQGQPLNVQLYRDEELFDSKPIQIPADGGTREVSFTLDHSTVGINTYRAWVEPLPDEEYTKDNEYAVTISVSDPRNLLLYVEGVPRFEYRFLRRLLLADEQIASAIFYSGPDGKPISGSDTGQVTADMSESELLRFKIVILGNLGADELSDRRAENLARFVENGGSLVLLGGSRGWGESGFKTTALKSVLPVESHGQQVVKGDDPFPVQLTVEGRAHPAFAGEERFWDQVPPILSVFPDARPKPGAEVLVTANTPQGSQPVIISQRYGQGRVAAVFTDTLWRWQLNPDPDDNEPYARFWKQLLLWMLPKEDEDAGRDIDIFTDRDQVYAGEELDISARFADPERVADKPLEARITTPDERVLPYVMQPQQVVTPGGRSYPGFQVSYTAVEPGYYTVVAAYGEGPDALVSDPVSFNVRAYTPETIPRPINREVLRSLAESSGGEFFETAEELNRFLNELEVKVVEEERSEFFSLWQRWFVLVPLMILLAGTWVLRKISHLP